MSYDHITQETLKYANLVRTNPQSIITLLHEKLSYFQGNRYKTPSMPCPIITNEGPAAVQEAIRALQNARPLAPFKMSDGMSNSARDHCNDIGPQGVCGHTGTNGSTMSGRLEKHGKWSGSIAENISFGQANGKDVICQLLIDDGVMNRGHRKNLMNPNSLRVGIFSGFHKGYQNLTVMTFASEYTEGHGGGSHGRSNPYEDQPYQKPKPHPQSHHNVQDPYQQHKPKSHHKQDPYQQPSYNQHHKNSPPKKQSHSNNFGGGYRDEFGSPDDWVNQQMTQMKDKHIEFFANSNKGYGKHHDDPYGSSRNDNFQGGGFGNNDFGGGFGNDNFGGGFGGGFGSQNHHGGNKGGNDMPPGAVQCIGTSSSSQSRNGHTVKKVTKTYQMADGSTKKVTTES